MSASPLPSDLRDWIEATTGGSVVEAHRHLAGASRQAWSVDVKRDGDALALFALRDNLSGSGGSQRDAAVLRALRGTTVPVPEVHGDNAALRAVLAWRFAPATLAGEPVEGRLDVPVVFRLQDRRSSGILAHGCQR